VEVDVGFAVRQPHPTTVLGFASPPSADPSWTPESFAAILPPSSEWPESFAIPESATLAASFIAPASVPAGGPESTPVSNPESNPVPESFPPVPPSTGVATHPFIAQV
jgi:hypothetical protein